MPENCRMIHGKKYMWDGEIFEREEQAKAAAETYEKDGYEATIVKEEGKVLVYSRREVKEVVVEGTPPV